MGGPIGTTTTASLGTGHGGRSVGRRATPARGGGEPVWARVALDLVVTDGSPNAPSWRQVTTAGAVPLPEPLRWAGVTSPGGPQRADRRAGRRGPGCACSTGSASASTPDDGPRGVLPVVYHDLTPNTGPACSRRLQTTRRKHHPDGPRHPESAVSSMLIGAEPTTAT